MAKPNLHFTLLPRPEHGRFDHSPGFRLTLLGCLFAAGIVIVLLRLAHVQLVLAPWYLQQLTQPTVRIRLLPTERGRILAADGTVLAMDVPTLSLCVHYRYLERPIDEDWLNREARRRLSPVERRSREKLLAEQRRLRRQMAHLRHDLSELLGCPEEVLQESAADVQERVERISRRVNAARLSASAQRRSPGPPFEGPWWQHLWTVVYDALTTEPEPSDPMTVVLKEETQYHPIYTWPAEQVQSPRVLAVVAEIEGNPQRYPGVRIERHTRRVYQYGTLGCHVTGYLGAITGEELARASSRFDEPTLNRSDQEANLWAYQSDDMVGRQGVEAAYESILRGRRGAVREVVDPQQAQVLAELEHLSPVAGHDVVLWLQPQLQRRAEELLEAAVTKSDADAEGQTPPNSNDARPPQGGAIVVLDVRSGGVLAAASIPRFDPNLLIDPDPATWTALNSDPGRPFFNRVTRMAIPPGSVFKIVTATAALESRRIDPQAEYFCRGYLHRPDRLRCLIYQRYGRGHSFTNWHDALVRSCNVYFFHCAERLGPEPICQWAHRFGFGQPTGIDLPGEAPGFVPTPDNARKQLGHPWRRGDTPRLAIGQSALLTTPVQIARLMAAVATGKLVTPRLVQRTVPRSASREESAPESTSDPVTPVGYLSESSIRPSARPVEGLDPNTLSAMRTALHAVVADPQGTAHRTVFLPDLPVAGKTGTAEAGPQGDHAWFAGYAPSDEPRVAFVIVLEHGGSGGREAAPLARELLQTLDEIGYFDR